MQEITEFLNVFDEIVKTALEALNAFNYFFPYILLIIIAIIAFYKIIQLICEKAIDKKISSYFNDAPIKHQVLSDCCSGDLILYWDGWECRYYLVCSDCGKQVIRIKSFGEEYT